MNNCIHSELICVNPYEIIRKYRCQLCSEVMMCACEQDFAEKFLPHQIDKGYEIETQIEVAVTLGFQSRICNQCRGLPEEAHPKAEMYGATSNVARYYWREIYFETTKRFAAWVNSQGFTDKEAADVKRHMQLKIRKDVTREFKDLHNSSPKYIYQEKSQDQVVRENNVELVRIEGIYSHSPESGLRIIQGDESYSVEDYAALYYRNQGFEVLFAESRPFHAMFAIFMWLLIQDVSDPLVRIAGFGERTVFDEGHAGTTIWTHLPSDFGSAGYATRRAEAIEQHFERIPHDREELLWLFDYWLQPSWDLRQYLWAHAAEDCTVPQKLDTKIMFFV